MEIIERAKGHSGDVISVCAKEKDIKDEIDIRTWKAGYTNRHGEPLMATKAQAQGIGESKLNVWPRDENGNLIE